MSPAPFGEDVRAPLVGVLREPAPRELCVCLGTHMSPWGPMLEGTLPAEGALTARSSAPTWEGVIGAAINSRNTPASDEGKTSL